ncbi:MAG: DUF5906 domain-containing protein [Promethearchaeota archaeon]
MGLDNKAKKGEILTVLNQFREEGKVRLNASSETSSRKIPVEYFKKYVGNEGKIPINRKYRPIYEAPPTAKLMFSFNDTFTELPDDTDKGFFRKCVLIEFPHDFSDLAARCDMPRVFFNSLINFSFSIIYILLIKN